MDEIRCPMCSTPNPAQEEVCRKCGARLKPLRVGPPSENRPAAPPKSEPPPAAPHGGGASEDLPAAPNWLDRIRSGLAEGEADEASEETADSAEGPDWLSRLREAGTGEDEGPPEGEVPDWVTEHAPPEPPPTVREPPQTKPAAADAAPGRGTPDWLARIREREAQAKEAPPPEGGEGLARFRDDAAAERSPAEEPPSTDGEDWLGRLRSEPVAEEPPPDEDSSTEESQAWLERTLRDAGEEAPPDVAPPARRDVSPPPKRGVPAPLPETRELKRAPAPPEESEDWLGQPAEPAAAKPPPKPAAPVKGAAPRAPAARPAIPRPEPPLPETQRLKPPAPPIRRPAEDVPAAPAPVPGPTAEQGPPDEEPTKVPALIFDAGAPGRPSGEDVDLTSLGLPDWLSDVTPSAPEGAPREAPARGLAPASIPSWLEAMRPVDAFRSVSEVESDEEQVVEAAGPLAGLRGVLLAEPVVAMPHAPGVAPSQAEVAERHYAQAELLQRMLEEEAHEAPLAQPRRRTPLLRWIVGAVLLLAVALPAVTGATPFPAPSTAQWPPELVGLLAVLDRLPTDRSALLVFDYEPGYAAEMEAVAGPVIDGLFRHGTPLATVTTRPTGGFLAERILARYASANGLAAGEGYVHLGFLPGGPTAAQAFLTSPRQVSDESEEAWGSPTMAGVETGADFGAVFLISAGAESARMWVEQAGPVLGPTPLLAVVSAGVEPLLRPYYDATDPMLDAMVSGLPMAMAHEQANGMQADASARWNPYGSAMLAAEVLLAFGAAYGLAAWLARRRLP